MTRLITMHAVDDAHVTQNDYIPQPASVVGAPSTDTPRAQRLWHLAVVSAMMGFISAGASSTARCARPNVVA